MPTCPAGHRTSADDYCDTCGLPIEPGQGSDAAPAQPSAAPAAPAGAQCPNCGTVNAPDALFCEACGYDFTTGTLPRTATPQAVEPVETPGAVETPAPVEPVETPAPSLEPVETPAPSLEPVETPAPPLETPSHTMTPSPAGAHAPGEPAEPSEVAPPAEPWEAAPDPSPGPVHPHSARLLHPQPTTIQWVAEVWIDPDWYATQGSSDPLPSPGLPEVVPLRTTSALIGRVSISRNIHPEIDCDPDTGVSRRHAQITTDGTRWWIEDLESANGTFIGASAGPLPTMPIGRGRVEFAPDQRLYVGGWTRLVIRRATEDEQQAYS